jgi:hypothetical protein
MDEFSNEPDAIYIIGDSDVLVWGMGVIGRVTDSSQNSRYS